MSKPVSEQTARCANRGDPIQVLSVTKNEDCYSSQLLDEVFPTTELASEASADGAIKAISLSNLGDHLQTWLEDEVLSQNAADPTMEISDLEHTISEKDNLYTVKIHVKGLIQDSLSVTFEDSGFVVSFQTWNKSLLSQHKVSSEDTVFIWHPRLRGEVFRDKCTYTVSPPNLYSIEVNLVKKISTKWGSLKIAACEDSKEVVVGRLGPKDVSFQFDINTNVGTLIVDPDRLGLSSQSNFSSMRANCCVYKGKWMYEIMLGSKGVMQVGWCTIKCKFSQEEGVGDTPDSYAYDGNRQRKWNATTQKYGELWYTGDVITCTIDCDVGSIHFYRNGTDLGEAFSNVGIGPGYAYFPAVSLSLNENLRANFGATPLKYPIEGFSPIQSRPTVAIIKTQLLLGYMDTLVHLSAHVEQEGKLSDESCVVGADKYPTPLTDCRSKQSNILMIVSHVFDKLAPLLRSPYLTEECLMQLLLRLTDVTIVSKKQPLITKLLDYMWAFMQGFEIKTCLENLLQSLLASYRFSPVTTDFQHQKQHLTLVLAILRHQQTRRYLLENEIFEKVRFVMFLHIKPLDYAGLEEVTPVVWWDMNSNKNGDTVTMSPEETANKEAYMKSCDQLRNKIEEIENIQVELLKVLMYHKDQTADNIKTSRQLFIEILRKFLKDNMLNQLTIWPLPISWCFFHRLLQALRFYWDDFQKEDPSRFVMSTDAFMPIQEFWSDSRDYFDVQRCGGSMSHLNRILGSEVNKAQGIELSKDGKVVQLQKTETEEREYPPTEMPSGNSLMEILDGVMLLYHIAAHKQLGKMSSLLDTMQEFIQSYKDTISKLESSPPEMTDVHEELERAKDVFLQKIHEQARQMTWVRAVVYSKQKQDDVAWLLKVAMTTVKKASKFKLLFQYMPEYYLENIMHSYNALKNYFHPTVAFNSLADYDDLLREFALFLVNHFSDGRIVVADTRDNIIQALACFSCYKHSLNVLENLPLDRCNFLLRSLIGPYENRSWIQTNWILVRIWKGCGFGYRYTHLPHLVPSKVQLTEFGTASVQEPCPSIKFQGFLSAILYSEQDVATRFLDTLLNQLNWSFSEFIGMMQEIQQVISRSVGRMLLESRQLKICATCFEISVCLFRVIEMVVNVSTKLFTDWQKQSAELLMNRLIQLICLVLSRITLKNGMFDNVVSMYITGLESVTHYPMLAVISGILTKLVLNTDTQCQKLVTQLLLSDPGFKVSSLEFMLGGHQGGNMSDVKRAGLGDKIFDFRNYSEVSAEEVTSMEALISHIKCGQQTFVHDVNVIKEEDLCKICYSNQNSAIFRPCAHQSCRACINHQLLIKKECFFCKAIINSIEDLSGVDILANTPSKHS